MNILSIHLKNIKSHRDTTISFSAGINVLSGPNGVGKSTIFEAIGYALFGVDARDFVSNVERFLSIGTKRGEIAVQFRCGDGEVWQVMRTVGANTKWLLARESGGSFEVEEHAGIEETEARIAGLLGLTAGRPLADQFKLVIGPFQNDFLGPFIIRQPTRRQEAFDEILGIDAWRKTYKGTAAMLAALQEQLKIRAAEVVLLQEQVAVLPLKEEELAINRTAAANKAAELLAQEAALAELETLLAGLDGQEKAIAALSGELERLAERIKAGGDKIVGQSQRVEEARAAGTLLEGARPGKEAFERAELRLGELRQREQQRRLLEKELAALEQEAQRLQQKHGHEQVEIATAESRLGEEDKQLTAERTQLQPDAALQAVVAGLVELRRSVEQHKGERALLEGRREALQEGEEKLAEGICPFFQEQCANVAGVTPQDVFSGRIGGLEKAMAECDTAIVATTGAIVAAEGAEKELANRAARLVEVDRQAVKLAERRAHNRERAALLAVVAEELAAAVQRVTSGRASLATFTDLDREIATTEEERQANQAARDAFTVHQKDAADLDNRLLTLEKWQGALTELTVQATAGRETLAALRSAYQEERHVEARREREQLLTSLATVRQQNIELDQTRRRLEQELAALRRIRETLVLKQADIVAAEEKEKLVKFLRNQVFKNVSAQLSERFREEISLRADRIYRTIAEADEELHWGENYRIELRDLSEGMVRERSDDQLSGGQMMSAVVALRLALLQTIGARIAFFDEPTSNLDSARRENLAQAFRAIDAGREGEASHWYDQLFLVSHDVAFTEITDQMIELKPQ